VVSSQKPFKDLGISLGGYILTSTRLEEIPDVGGKDWQTLARQHNVLRQEGDYLTTILKP
jgi:hypothetical protein